MSTTAGGIVIPEEVDLSGIDTTHPDIQQFDLWLPGQDFFDEMSAVQLRLGLDTIDPSVLHGLQFFWLAGYIGGNWPDFHPLCLAYPVLARAGRIFSYAVTASEDADWLDCELGDASVPEADPW